MSLLGVSSHTERDCHSSAGRCNLFCAVLHISSLRLLILPHSTPHIGRALAQQPTIGAFQILIAHLVQKHAPDFLPFPGRNSKTPAHRHGAETTRASLACFAHVNKPLDSPISPPVSSGHRILCTARQSRVGPWWIVRAPSVGARQRPRPCLKFVWLPGPPLIAIF